jgi:hypothetical protein
MGYEVLDRKSILPFFEQIWLFSAAVTMDVSYGAY